MAYSKTIYYVLDLINSGFVREMNEKDAKEYVLSGKWKLYDKDNNCVANENPWLDWTKTEPANEAVADAKPEQPVEESAEVTNEENQDAPKKWRKAKSE